jgi:hypothetical protein
LQIKFGKMNREQQELLHRVKLLMGYDTKKTLSENHNIIIEQPWLISPPIVGLTDFAKDEEWKPQFDQYEGINGPIRVPKGTKISKGGLTRLRWTKTAKKDELGYYQTFAQMNATFNGQVPYKFNSSGVVLNFKDDTKLYYPTESWLSQFADVLSAFVIPAGTMIPKWDDENNDWSEIPLPADVRFDSGISCDEEFWFKRVLIDDVKSDPSRGWRAWGYCVFDRAKGGCVETYDEKKYIQFKAPDQIFWDEWGNVIQWGGTILSIVLMIPTLGTSLTFGATLGTRLFITTAIDLGVNLVSAHYHFKEGDTKAAMVDIFVGLLSAGVEFPGISKLLTGGLDDFAQEAALKHFLSKKPKSYDDFVKHMEGLSTVEQKNLRNVLDRKELQDAVKEFAESQNSPISRVMSAMDSKIAKVTRQSKGGLLWETIKKNVRFKLPIVMSPVLIAYGPEVAYVLSDMYKAYYGKEPSTEVVQRMINNIDANYPEQSSEELAQLMIDSPEAFAQVVGDEKIIEDVANKKFFNKEVKNSAGQTVTMKEYLENDVLPTFIDLKRRIAEAKKNNPQISSDELADSPTEEEIEEVNEFLEEAPSDTLGLLQLQGIGEPDIK